MAMNDARARPLKLRLAADMKVSGSMHAVATDTEETAGDLPEGTYAVRSSIHGMFYHRPRPDEPPYVEIGTLVDQGTTLGLVEVMKCFSAVVYGGQGLPSRAESCEGRADEGAEVKTDQILFVVRQA